MTFIADPLANALEETRDHLADAEATLNNLLYRNVPLVTLSEEQTEIYEYFRQDIDEVWRRITHVLRDLKDK
jgi:hypothetical protein